jgi:hypothetical protein
MDEKIYTQEIIVDNPFPGQDKFSVLSDAQSGVKYTYSNDKTQPQPFPKRNIANGVIGASINTLSKKILGVFEFLKQGAIQIGEYINGISGEIKISPDGIVAKNKNGDTTFAIDGDTGDATFKGTVVAGGVDVIDDQGLISLSSFDSNSVVNTTEQQIMHGAGYVDVTNLTLTFTLTRTTKVLFSAIIEGFCHEDASALVFEFMLDNVFIGSNFIIGGIDSTFALPMTTTGVYLGNIAAGTHTIKVRALNSGTTDSCYISYDGATSTLMYLTLGR